MNPTSPYESYDSFLFSEDSSGSDHYLWLMEQIKSNSPNILSSFRFSFQRFFYIVFDADLQEKYSKPMPWIGMYMVLASLVCILAMVADLLHGLKSRKLWFPCKYFTLNAASLTVIGVAIKLPMDLNNSMPGELDQAAKLGSLAFMCTMMANSLPSLASMESKQLFENVVALGVLLITLVVNVCIQISTDVVSDPNRPNGLDQEVSKVLYNETYSSDAYSYAFVDQNQVAAVLYVAMLLVLLIIYTCSALGIMESKRILESKYQEANKIALEGQEGEPTVERLKRHISKHWIMAGTGSPQFMTVCSPTTSASGAICCLSAVLLCIVMIFIATSEGEYDSDYEWSVPVILITQSIGVILGSIAPLCRCFASLSFKVSREWLMHHIKVWKVESFWTKKLWEWKYSSIAFQFRSHKLKKVVEKSKFIFLTFRIGFQKTVVVGCKMIALPPVFFGAAVLLLLNIREPKNQNTELKQYVVQFQGYMKPTERTLNRLLTSMNRTIKKAKKRRPKKLKELLLDECKKVAETLDSHHVSPLLQEKFLNCWSLELVTLTTIVRSLPTQTQKKKKVESLIKSVSEGLEYVTLVDECQNATDRYVSIQKAAKFLWLEVEVHGKWLQEDVKDLASQHKTAKDVLEWFKDTSAKVLKPPKEKNVKAGSDVNEGQGSDGNEGDGLDDIVFRKSMCAKSMEGITQILLSYQDDSEQVIFDRLTSMISHSLATSLSKLPRVIEMKCETNVIDKREESVDAAAQLLGKTEEIINILVDPKHTCLSLEESTSGATKRKCFCI